MRFQEKAIKNKFLRKFRFSKKKLYERRNKIQVFSKIYKSSIHKRREKKCQDRLVIDNSDDVARNERQFIVLCSLEVVQSTHFPLDLAEYSRNNQLQRGHL